jgi:hypothetical protein
VTPTTNPQHSPTVTPSRTPSPSRTPTSVPGQPSNTPNPTVTNAPVATNTAGPTLGCAGRTGDANGDCRVDDADYLIMLAHFGQHASGGPSIGDFSNNGIVDGVDYVIWFKNAQF